MGLFRFLWGATKLLLVLLLVALLVGGAWVLTHRDDARAWRQSAIVGAHVSEDEDISSLVSFLDADIEPAKVVDVDELPARHVLPEGDDDVPAVVILVPPGTSLKQDGQVARTQRAIARAGLAAWAVRTPGDEELLANPKAAPRVFGAIADIATHERTRDGHVSIVAAGAAASIVLRAVAEGVLVADVPAIIAAMPIADAQSFLRAALTDPEFDEDLRVEVGRAIAEMGARLVDEDQFLAQALLRRAEESDDPLEALRTFPARFVPADYRGLVEVVQATTPEQFDAAWKQLDEELVAPAIQASALEVADEVDARVLVVNDPTHPAAAAVEADRIAEAIPDSRRLVIDADATIDTTDVGKLLDLARWWLVRGGE